MSSLDMSQSQFCESTESNIRLLAPAGCGKTISLLHRCRSLVSQASGNPRFLMITFTNAAAEEIKDRQVNDPDFECLRDRVTVNTLNAYGWRRIRNSNRVSNAELLTNGTKRHFAVLNQLRPVWIGKSHIEPVVTTRGRNARTLLDVMDNLKSMGFDHTLDTNMDKFLERIRNLEMQGASWRIDEQFELLTGMGILDAHDRVDNRRTSGDNRAFYNRFFTFWREATSSLLAQSTFTFEDQKYWSYLDLRSPGPDGKSKPYIYGAARYDHILVDEFQDINPLDLALIKVIVERNQSTLTIVGDDDQAIYEWRGASPEYILQPQQYFGAQFKDYQLETNYRSPTNIVNHSQNLISHNKNRVIKKVKAAENAGTAEISVMAIDSISDRLRYVTDIVRNTEYPGKVAVIGHRRSHLIPYEIYFASDGAPFKTAADLDIFSAKAFDDFTDLLGVWSRSADRTRPGQAVNDALAICNLIKRFPLNRRDSPNLTRHLQRERPRTTYEAVQAIADYTGTSLSGKSHTDLHKTAQAFLSADDLKQAIEVIDKEFAGLRFDLDKQEESIWHTDPPLRQLAEIAETEGYDADDLIDRIETAKAQIQEYRDLEEGAQDNSTLRVWERPLHLMTAWRAKGKEFETVILLDTVQDVWPDYRKAKSERGIEEERRLFYVAFTRAQQRVIMLTKTGAAISPFVNELDLPSD
ncbi:MAG: ATP-dependent helicase [Chloroflexi bacterium]|nr:ATP-dependent helicase [Chloroflexota bacterium]